MKKYKKIIIIILVILVLVTSGILITKYLSKSNQDSSNQNELLIKESLYTLDEIYAIIENPEEFYKLTTGTSSPFSYTLFHFYDYFSQSTPIKIATEVERDENGQVTKVLEVDYISYQEYNEKFAEVFLIEQEELELCERASKEEGKEICNENFSYFNYGYWVKSLIYDGFESVVVR